MSTVPDDVSAFPLCWPEAWPRTKNRSAAYRFGDWTVYSATKGLLEQIRLLGGRCVIISTSVPLRRDGVPLSKPPVDGDPGVAVYFERKGIGLCLPCDRYTDVADNIHAIALALEAMRALERHATPQLLEAAFKGFSALPAPPTWRDELGACKTLQEAEASYRAKARSAHPDTGGDHEAMSALNAAIEAARAEFEASAGMVTA